MKVKELSTCPIFGYESKYIHHKDSEKRKWKQHNLEKIMSCVPFLGQGVAICSLITGGKERFKERTDSYNFRLIVTALGLSIFLLPVDVAVTAKRKIQQLHMERKAKKA